MDFAALPPEINSGRMYAGPGSQSLLTAAAAWDELASELYTTAASYRSVISGLTSGPWQGASSAAMAAAASPYAGWLSATAAQAEQTSAQAKAAAAAHATAYAMTVPPALIAANRTQLTTLVATNFFGQNAPAIAATEAQYAEMWAQDASAMYSYAAAAQVASQMTPFSTPPQTADPAGLAAQNAATAQVAGTSAGQASVNQVLSALPQAAQALTSSNAATNFPNLENLGFLSDIWAIPQDAAFDAAIIAAFFPEYFIGGAGLPTPFGLGGAAPAATAAALPLGLAPIEAAPGLTGAALSASVGQADSVSGLSVPKAWATMAPEMRLAAAELPAATSAVAAGGSGAFGGMPLLGGAPLMGVGPRGSAASLNKEDKAEEAKRKAAKGRRSTMW